MDRPEIPAFIRDLGREPGSLRTLLVACLSLLAAGLCPRVFWPGLGSVQVAIRERTDAETILLIAAVLSAGVLLIGGVLGDADGRRRIQTSALAVLVVADLSGLLVTDGPLFTIGRLVGFCAASVVLPIALAGVAATYQGIPRATAIGLAYAAYGGATAIGPILLDVFGPDGSRWPAFAASSVVGIAALVAVRRSWPDLPSIARSDRVGILATATWAFGVVIVTVAVTGFRNDMGDIARVVLFVVGVVILAVGVVGERLRSVQRRGPSIVDRRAVTVALFVGFVIGYAQSAPLLQLPIYFQAIMGYGPILALVATLPFMVALVLAGPIAGYLLGRFEPRTLVALGVAAVGAGNIALALALGPRSPYGGFGVAFVLIGAGFVVSTTVRTAIIFASVPRGLPATAAALNEVSLSLGTRAGLVMGTVLIQRLTLDSYAASIAYRPAAEVQTAVDTLQGLLVAIGTPAIGGLVAGISPADTAAYAAVYTDAVRTVLIGIGLLTFLAAAIAWRMLGRRDPLRTVWDHRDERDNVIAT